MLDGSYIVDFYINKVPPAYAILTHSRELRKIFFRYSHFWGEIKILWRDAGDTRVYIRSFFPNQIIFSSKEKKNK